MASKLPQPIFTPSTKAHSGHDENVSFDVVRKKLGDELAHQLKELSLYLYQKGSEYYAAKGFILADTKFEFGLDRQSNLLLIDELLTPDSSRIWAKEDYKLGISPPSYDKQILRDYLEKMGWDKKPPPPALPEKLIQKIHSRYIQLEERICIR